MRVDRLEMTDVSESRADCLTRVEVEEPRKIWSTGGRE